jgi:hypothetical protein
MENITIFFERSVEIGRDEGNSEKSFLGNGNTGK